MAGVSVQTEISNLGRRVNEMSQSLIRGGTLVEWDWQALYRDVVRLEDISGFRQESILLQSFLYALKRDAKKVDATFSKYAALYGKDFPWYKNRAMLGIALGRSEFVFDFLDYGYPLDDVGELSALFDVTSQLGLMLSAEEVFQRLIRLGVKRDKLLESPINSEVLAAAQFYRNHNINEREVAKRVAKASAVVAEQNGFLNSYTLHTVTDGILYIYSVQGDVERLLDLEVKIIEALHESFDDDFSDCISFSVTKM